MSKEAKYYCEYCNTEVGEKDSACPRCGRSFSSVKCGSCGYFGQDSEFSKGCPKCGKALNKPSAPGETGKSVRRKSGIDALPWWLFLAADIVLGGIILYLVFSRKV